jgi:ABC-2 type transport system ATP-binding protein
MRLALEFAGITKEYRSWPVRKTVRALQDFSLSVQSGEIFGFLGPNGAGKSTAIHLAMGFMQPSSGTGQMLGHSFGDASTRRRVGFLAENVSLYHRRAESAIRFYGGLNGLHGAAHDHATRTALEAVGARSIDVSREVTFELDAQRGSDAMADVAEVLFALSWPPAVTASIVR